jgi:CDP-glycerol glycerophosphotransferase
MPRVSVVVPIYNVEDYLAECLASLAAQTFEDLEVVMVDDGSTDGSGAIAESFAARDPRFKLVRRPNGGLSAARNTGIEAATGEFLAFVDSDDLVAPDAYEKLVGTLDKTGSDFASGNAHRLLGTRTRQVGFLSRPMAKTRLKTHITRQRTLLTDRTAWNKLWRRSFWDEHGLRFPEGRTYEDIPVTIPLHFAARSVDVLSDVIYYWRTREGETLSITQRRNEPRELDNRITAIQEVSEYLHRHGPRRAKAWYDATVVAQDLKYFLNALDIADDEYRAYFLDRVNRFLDGVSRRAFWRLPAVERLKWHLVRRRMMPELLEIRRFEQTELRDSPLVRIRGRWYADLPFRTDRSLRIPQRLFRIDKDLQFSSGLDRLRWEDGRLRIDGWAFIEGIGAPSRRTQRVTLVALAPGRLQSVRMRIAGVRVGARNVERRDPAVGTGGGAFDVTWSGFTATLSPRRLRSLGRWRDGRWDLYVALRVGRLRRYRARYTVDPARPLRAAQHVVRGGAAVAVEPSPDGEVVLRVRTRWATLHEHRIDGDDLVLAGELSAAGRGQPRLVAQAREDGPRHAFPVAIEGGRPQARFTSRVALSAVGGADAEYELTMEGDGPTHHVTLGDDAAAVAGVRDAREVALARSLDGVAMLVVRPPRATLDAASWSGDGDLEVAGHIRAPHGAHELVLGGRSSGRRHAFPIQATGTDGRFTATLTPARVASLDGDLPLAEGVWELGLGRAGQADPTPVSLADALYDRVPLGTVVEHKPFRLGVDAEGDAVLVVQRDLDPDERGRHQQRRLRATIYAPGRSQPLRDAVLYASFRGRQYSDSPRAIHEELVRRDAPLEHLWVVRDHACNVPPTATVLRSGSREHHEALARARYVVENDHFPNWFERRPDQVALQTWHGTPLKQLGFDVSLQRNVVRKFERYWARHQVNWQYVLSPNRFSTPILRRAYAIVGEMLETGYPRNDVLAGPARDAAARRVRERLGLPDGARVVLYAPTYRDHVRDADGRYRLEPALDVERLRAALGPDTIVLFRKHHYVIDPVPVTADGFVRDVSTYPDGTELMAAADVLVTDYSSMMFDFAVTGRPMLFFTYDLDAYRDEIRGFYFDFEAEAPGPLLQSTDELAAALADLDAVTAAHADRYRAFAARFCELDDGQAAARVVDRLFGDVLGDERPAATAHETPAPVSPPR